MKPGKPYDRLKIEISGWCNGMCKYCPTGQQNRISRTSQAHTYMDFPRFRELMQMLLQKQIIQPGITVDLFCWNEPFLNPDLPQIASWLSQNRFRYILSTNASRVPELTEDCDFSGLKYLTISMPGFSQGSYDKMHGFSFPAIVCNIRRLLSDLQKVNFRGRTEIVCHVYKFNLEEIEAAAAFADSLKVEFYPVLANPGSYEGLRGILSRDARITREYEKDLFTDYIPGLIRQRPAGYCCDQCEILILNTEGMVVKGWCTDGLGAYCAQDYLVCDPFAADLRQIQAAKQAAMEGSSLCEECRRLGIDYFSTHNRKYTHTLTDKMRKAL